MNTEIIKGIRGIAKAENCDLGEAADKFKKNIELKRAEYKGSDIDFANCDYTKSYVDKTFSDYMSEYNKAESEGKIDEFLKALE